MNDDAEELERITEEIFEKHGLNVVVSYNYDTYKDMEYIRVCTYVSKDGLDTEKMCVEYDIFHSVFDSANTEEILRAKSETAATELKRQIKDQHF